jgi:hypothetical protein
LGGRGTRDECVPLQGSAAFIERRRLGVPLHPDLFRTEEEGGRFLLRPGTWETTVLEEVKDAAAAEVSYATRCIPAIVHKIRRTYDTEAIAPKLVTHVT